MIPQGGTDKAVKDLDLTVAVLAQLTKIIIIICEFIL